jgi:hypothetical protein
VEAKAMMTILSSPGFIPANDAGARECIFDIGNTVALTTAPGVNVRAEISQAEDGFTPIFHPFES